MTARGYAELGDWSRAYRAYQPGFRDGFIGYENLWGMANAAAHLGKWREAYELFGKAADAYPFAAEPAAAMRERMAVRLREPSRRNVRREAPG